MIMENAIGTPKTKHNTNPMHKETIMPLAQVVHASEQAILL